jgi:FtsP/CotA-like multicopper oxidase with cupredoxin domain
MLVLAAGAAAQPSLQPPGWDQGIRLTEAVDLNPEPHVTEVNLEARLASVEIAPGRRVEAWTYNGGLPGPLIRVRVGDRLIVHFSNRLPKPTTVHWHGLRVPIQMDGVPDHSQPAVHPGEQFTYDFVVPDAGLYWYHPHVMSAAQVGFGLYGALLVEDPAEQTGVADDLVLVLSDIDLDDKTDRLQPADTGGSAGMAFGREGNRVLVNGRERPTLHARAGAPQRWRIVNAAKSRTFEVYMDGQMFVRIGGDGGLLEYSVESDSVLLAAGERADVIVVPRGEPGTELVVRSLLHDRGYGSVEYRDIPDLLHVAFVDQPPHEGVSLPRVTRAIEALSVEGATEVAVEFTLAQRPDGSFEYRINGEPFAAQKSIRAKVGETQIWTVINKTKWSHPFHLHGFFFQVLDEDTRPVRPMAWKDTVDVPYEQSRRFVVRFDDRPGRWMYHCHILDHADGGLMATVAVGVPDGDGEGPGAHTHEGAHEPD